MAAGQQINLASSRNTGQVVKCVQSSSYKYLTSIICLCSIYSAVSARKICLNQLVVEVVDDDHLVCSGGHKLDYHFLNYFL